MNLLKFEGKKFIKQKKYIWLLIAIFLITGALYSINSYQRSRLQGNWAKYSSLPEVPHLEAEWVRREIALVRKRDQGILSEMEELQLKHTNEIGLAIQRLRICGKLEIWAEIPRYKMALLSGIDNFLAAGGEFSALEGLEKEIVRGKNTWLLERGLPYELEKNPVTPHLFLKQTSTFLFSLLGLAILLIFFGNVIVEEKENCTWQTLRTQPISIVKLVLSKYVVFLVATTIFIITVIGVGVLLPMASQGSGLNLDYPQVIVHGDSFTIISTGQYILRTLIVFVCLSSFMISMSIVLSKWISRSVTLYFLTGITMAVGYFGTSLLKTPFNPFYMLNFREVVNAMPQPSDWIYVLTSVLWTVLLLSLAVYFIYLPEKRIKAKLTRDSKPFAGGNPKTTKLLLNLFIFEWRKTKREGTFKALVILTLIIAVAGQFFLTQIANQRKDDYFAELDWRTSAINEKILEIEHYEAYKAELYKEIEKIEGAKEAYHDGDWATFHKYQLHVIEKALNQKSPIGNFLETTLNDIDRYNEEVSLIEKKLLIERNIQPIFAGEYLATIHQNWRRTVIFSSVGINRLGWKDKELSKDEWENQNKKYDSSGLFILYHGITNYIYFLPVALLMFLFGGSLAKEKGKRQTYNFLKTQPITEKDIFLSKSLKIFTVTIASVLTILLIIIAAGTVLNRFGDWNYPVIHYNSWKVSSSPDYSGFKAGFGYGFYFINLGEYLLKGAILITSLTMLFMAVSTVLSLFLKRNLSVLTGTVLILAGGYYLNMKKYLRMTHRSPFTYFDIPRILNGEIGTRLNEPRINAITGAVVLCALSILVILVGYLLTHRNKLYLLITRNWKKGTLPN